MLENSELAVSHTAENVGEAIKECTDHWRITKKVSCTTVDNASNIHKCMDTVLAWPYLHCFAHTLNLAVKALRGFTELLADVLTLWLSLKIKQCSL